MKKVFVLLSVAFFYNEARAQNIGIGTTSPAERLDVAGNLNIAGQLKLANDSGAANQVQVQAADGKLLGSYRVVKE